MAASIDMRNSLCTSLRTSQVLVATLGLTLLGCGGDTAGPAERATASDDYWALRLNQHVITLAVTAPHNTIQLHATPMTEAGTALPSSAVVTYTILGTDTSLVVSATGVVTALTPSYQNLIFAYNFPVSGVIASLTIDGVTLADTALVRVTATAPAVPLQRISMQPPAESLALYQDGHWLVYGGPRLLTVKQFDVNGDTVSNNLIAVRSSDLNIGFGGSDGCDTRPLCMDGVKPQADVTFSVQLWYYGVDVSDSLRVHIGYPHYGSLSSYQTTPVESRDVQLYWWPATVELTTPAQVGFTNSSNTIPLDATFDHPELVHEATDSMNAFFQRRGYFLPMSAEGNIVPFYTDTVGADAACAQRIADPTNIAADSACRWLGNRSNTRYRVFTTPGTYGYHTRFGNEGKIIVH